MLYGRDFVRGINKLWASLRTTPQQTRKTENPIAESGGKKIKTFREGRK